MKKLIHKILKFKRYTSFVFADKKIKEEWILFSTFKFSIYKKV